MMNPETAATPMASPVRRHRRRPAGLPTPPPRHRESAAPGTFRRLIRQAALPNPGVPGEQEQSPAPARCIVEPGKQLTQLAVPLHQYW
jgi:hypothetical protein